GVHRDHHDAATSGRGGPDRCRDVPPLPARGRRRTPRQPRGPGRAGRRRCRGGWPVRPRSRPDVWRPWQEIPNPKNSNPRSERNPAPSQDTSLSKCLRSGFWISFESRILGLGFMFRLLGYREALPRSLFPQGAAHRLIERLVALLRVLLRLLLEVLVAFLAQLHDLLLDAPPLFELVLHILDTLLRLELAQLIAQFFLGHLG